MRNLTAFLCLTFAVLLFSAGEGFALPPCPEDQDQRFHNCFGTYTFASGSKYVGEWSDDKKHGQGTLTFADGEKYVGEFRDGKWHGQGTEIFFKNPALLKRQLDAQRELQARAKQGNSGAQKRYGELVLQDFVYGSDIQKLENLGKSVETLCKHNIKCAFDGVWMYLDISKDNRLSLAEIARFQRNIVKFAAVHQDQNALKVEEIAAINLASIMLLPITASSILHSFDYNNDGLLSKNEVLGDTEFSNLVGVDINTLATGLNFQSLGEKLQSFMNQIPFLK
jgi:hypothetical protein